MKTPARWSRIVSTTVSPTNPWQSMRMLSCRPTCTPSCLTSTSILNGSNTPWMTCGSIQVASFWSIRQFIFPAHLPRCLALMPGKTVNGDSGSPPNTRLVFSRKIFGNKRWNICTSTLAARDLSATLVTGGFLPRCSGKQGNKLM